MQHTFGGGWTDEKLGCLREYLEAYTKIFNKNPRAQYFRITYVDAFAGTGYRSASSVKSDPKLPYIDTSDHDVVMYLKGSARIALEVEPPFHQYLFIDKNPQHVRELEALKTNFPSKANLIQIKRAEANVYLTEWCEKTDWSKNRAVVFLDPYGMQVDWSLIQSIARTKAIDLWLLFPLGVAINRLMTKDEPPPEEWAQALTRAFGTDQWRQAFYPKQKTRTLFGDEENESKQAGFDEIGRFFIERLQEIFTRVADAPLQLCNSKNTPIYLLCFAAGNPIGAATAVKIAQYIIRKKQRGAYGRS